MSGSAQDFAKPARSRRQPKPAAPSALGLLATGFAAGVFVSLVAWLWLGAPAGTTPGVTTPTLPQSDAPTAGNVREDDKLRLEFYEMFPRSEVPVVEEYTTAGKVTLEPVAYLLQVGSFRREQDAGALRARLILEGYEVMARETEVDGVTWHRVLVGPLDSVLTVNRIQDQLAAANIESIKLVISP